VAPVHDGALSAEEVESTIELENHRCSPPSSYDVEVTFQPVGEQTAVTWSMTGKKNFTAKAIHLVMNLDKMCGGMFEQGLASLKAVVEAAPKTATLTHSETVR